MPHALSLREIITELKYNNLMCYIYIISMELKQKSIAKETE